jgi:hypothetical protein
MLAKAANITLNVACMGGTMSVFADGNPAQLTGTVIMSGQTVNSFVLDSTTASLIAVKCLASFAGAGWSGSIVASANIGLASDTSWKVSLLIILLVFLKTSTGGGVDCDKLKIIFFCC